jgi:hypothetical protein
MNAWAKDIHLKGDFHPSDPLHVAIQSPVLVSRWLLRNFTALMRLPDVGEFADALFNAWSRAVRVIDRPPDKVFAGLCNTSSDGVNCAESLYGLPGGEGVKCVACGAEHNLKDRRAWMLEHVEDELAYSGLLAGLITSLGIPIASATIRKYAQKGKIVPVDFDTRNRPRYRVGDVLDVFLKRDEEKFLEKYLTNGSAPQ